MFIDIHAHAHKWPRPALTETSYPFPTAEQLLGLYDRIGVEKAVLLPLIGPECQLPQSNEEILDIAESHAGRFIPFINISPRAISNSPNAPLGRLMRYYKNLGAKGLGEVTANMDITDPYVWNYFRHAEESELPVTIHLATQIGGTYGLVDAPGLPGLQKVLKSFPGLKIFAHSQVFWAEISVLNDISLRSSYPKGKVIEGAVPRMFREFPNLYGDLSAGSGCNALTRDPEYAVKFLNEFQDRLMFGLDVCRPPDDSTPALVTFLQVLRGQDTISQTIFDKVARKNAIRLLGI